VLFASNGNGNNNNNIKIKSIFAGAAISGLFAIFHDGVPDNKDHLICKNMSSQV
jgi:hypothetical protein